MSALTAWARGADRIVPRQRTPAIEADVGWAIPAWALRIVAAVLVVAPGLLVTTSLTIRLVIAAIALAVLWSPGNGVPVFAAAILAWGLLGAEPGPLIASVMLLCVHAMLVITRAIGSVGWEAKVDRSAIGRVAVPFLVIQAIAQLALHAAHLLPNLGPVSVWLAIGALAALIVLTGALVRVLRTVPQ